MDDNNTCNYLLFYINAGYKRVLNTQASNFIYSLSILGHIDFEMEVGKLIKFQIVKKDAVCGLLVLVLRAKRKAAKKNAGKKSCIKTLSRTMSEFRI